MKKFKFISLVLLASILGLSNCDVFAPKKKNDNTALLLGLAYLASQQQSYEATVSIVGYLQQADGTTIRDGRVSIINAEGKEVHLVDGQGDIKEFTKCQTDTAPSTVDVNKQDGQFTITFKVKAATGSVGFSAVRQKDGTANNTKKCSDIANFKADDYTSSVGSALFTINVKNNKDLDQLTVTNESGLKLTIKSVETVVKGTYNLQSPTNGENVCDGKSVTGSPTPLSGNLTTQTINGAAQLTGTVIVPSGVTLTVEAGSVIFGNRGSSLFVFPGGKLVTKGTKDKPVCFTSSQSPGSRFPGDWGGIVLIGNGKGTRSSSTEGTSPQNYGGGSNDADSSGSLEYTIIEFAGNEVAPGDELNALSMYAVGSGTKVEYVQVHRGLDDGFEAWGGAVNLKYVVATGGLDDDYDLDEGYEGSIQYAIGHKYPATCGGSFSTDPHGFEMDGVHSGSSVCAIGTAQRCTRPTLSNFTMIGADISGGEAARLREGFAGNISNSVFYNFKGNSSGAVIVGGNNSGFPANAYTIQNTVFAQIGKTATINAESTSAVQLNLSAMPITSEGDTAGCGFGANKPDYTTTQVAASAGGKWWADWTVYRAR